MCIPHAVVGKLRPSQHSMIGILVVLWSSIPVQPMAGQTDDTEIKRRFLDDAPKAWTEYLARVERLQGTIINSFDVDAEKRFHLRHLVMANETCKLILTQSLLDGDAPVSSWKSNRGEVYAYNRDYGFQIIRKKEAEPWVLKNLTLNKQGIENAPSRDLEATQESGISRALLQVGSTYLMDLVKQTNFVVLRAIRISRQGAELVQIDFANPHPLKEDGKTFFPIQSGTVILDPERYWCLRSCQLECKYYGADSKVSGETEFKESSAKFPIPKRWSSRTETRFEDGRKMMVALGHREFDLRETASLPGDEEFYMSAFGLPEPVGITAPKRTPWYLWFMATAAASLAFGGLMFLVRRRYFNSTPSKK